MYVDYNPNSEQMGVNFDVRDWFNIDLNVAANQKLKDAAKEGLKKLSKRTGFDFFGLFDGGADDKNLWFGFKPSTVIIGAGAIIGTVAIIAAATKKKKPANSK